MRVGKRFASVVASGALLAVLVSSPATASNASAHTVAQRKLSVGSVVNPFSPAFGHSYRQGAVPTIGQLAKMRRYAATHRGIAALPHGPVFFHGGVGRIGVTSSTPKVYLVFWGKQWGTQGVDGSGDLKFSKDSKHGAPYMQRLIKGLGTDGESWSGTMTQYCDGPGVAKGAKSCSAGAAHVGYPTGGATLAGVWYDNSKLEPAAATVNQIGAEAVEAAGHFGNATEASNRYVQYVILSAPGLNPDHYRTNGFCAWHFDMHAAAGYIAFTNMPYLMDVGRGCGVGAVNSPGTLDGYSIIEGHEYAETLTDQNPTGGWLTAKGAEVGDICAWIATGQGHLANVTMSDGSFPMQSTWSNDTKQCDISHPTIL